MKKLTVLLLLLIPVSLNASIHGEIWTGFQINYPAYTSVLTPVTRLRLSTELLTPIDDLTFSFRAAASYGALHQGSTPLMTPANNVAVTNPGIALDDARVNYTINYFEMSAGMIDPACYDPEWTGFYVHTLAGTNETGFLSSHFSRLLAQNGTDQYYNRSIPAVLFRFVIIENLVFRFGATFGLATNHLFVRNAFPAELSYQSRRLRVSLNFGLADADSSTVHKMSPSYGAIVEVSPVNGLTLFANYSIVGSDITTFRTPENSDEDLYKVAKEFSPFYDHLAIGAIYDTGNTAFGLGYSMLHRFNNPSGEEVVELFMRVKVLGMFEITPSFQLVLNPGGDSSYPYVWPFLPEFDSVFAGQTVPENAKRYVYFAGVRFVYRFDIDLWKTLEVSDQNE